jgi:hypothetical protein
MMSSKIKSRSMSKEIEVKDYLHSLTYVIAMGRASAHDSNGVEVLSIEISADDGDVLPDGTMLALLKDEIIHRQFPGYWMSLFIQGKSTAGLF